MELGQALLYSEWTGKSIAYSFIPQYKCELEKNKLIFLYVSKNQALQILYLKHHDNVYKTS